MQEVTGSSPVSPTTISPQARNDRHSGGHCFYASAVIDHDDPIKRHLGPDEAVRGVVDAKDGRLILTDRRVLVTENGRISLDVPIDNVRLIEFDVAQDRPAKVIIVPTSPLDAPRELDIEPQQYHEVASLLQELGPKMQGPESQ